MHTMSKCYICYPSNIAEERAVLQNRPQGNHILTEKQGVFMNIYVTMKEENSFVYKKSKWDQKCTAPEL